MIISRDQLLKAILHQCRICKHLYSTIPAGALDYRPTPEQRSTLELLQYLSICGIGSMKSIVENDWKHYGPCFERAAEMKAEEFPAAMDRQMEEMTAIMSSLSDEDLTGRRTIDAMGEEVPIAAELMGTTLGWLTAYRMQLFLYAKAAGAERIGTADCWSGINAEPQANSVAEER